MSKQNGSFKVKTNIPIPVKKTGRFFKYTKYPFAEMKVGDSFLVSDEKRGRISAAAVYFTSRYQSKFSIRTTESGEVRCWRVS